MIYIIPLAYIIILLHPYTLKNHYLKKLKFFVFIKMQKPNQSANNLENLLCIHTRLKAIFWVGFLNYCIRRNVN